VLCILRRSNFKADFFHFAVHKRVFIQYLRVPLPLSLITFPVCCKTFQTGTWFQHLRDLFFILSYIIPWQWKPPVAARSSAERLLGLRVRIPRGAWMSVSCTVFVLSGRGLCDRPIPRPEASYRLWYVSECDQVKNKTLYTCCEQVEVVRTTKRNEKWKPSRSPKHQATPNWYETHLAKRFIGSRNKTQS
jgi:hypothetical protein